MMWEPNSTADNMKDCASIKIPNTTLIDGKLVSAADGATFDLEDPSTGDTIGTLPRCGERDVSLAVESARKTFDSGSWSSLSGYQRGRVLRTYAEIIRDRQRDFALLETLENGKPVVESKWAALAVADVVDFYAGWADKLHGEQIPLKSGAIDILFREPVGVVGCITPWNFPSTQPSFKAIPALAMGNSVVSKPAEQCCATAVLMAELALEAGIPEGAWNVVTGYGHEAGSALVAAPGVDAISFTGSTDTGRKIMTQAAARLLPVSLECGGKCANVIFDDADLEKAVAGAVVGGFYNQGEVCNAGARVLVQQTIYDEFKELYVRAVQKLKVGNPFDPTTTLGSLVSKDQKERVVGFIEAGKSEGLEVAFEGHLESLDGSFVAPTIFECHDVKSTVFQEEIFGPVVTLMPFTDEEDALMKINCTTYGLATGFWTKDVTRVFRMSRKIESGTVWVNTFGPFDIAAPWTGYKNSGLGTEWGKEMLNFVTRPKNLWINTA